MVEPVALEVAADWRTLQTPETYTGYRQASGFAQADVARFDQPLVYARPSACRSTTGAWPGPGRSPDTPRSRTSRAHGSPSRSTPAMSTSSWDRRRAASSIGFRVFLDGEPAVDAHGSDVAADGNGTLDDQRTYQLIRQSGAIVERVFEIEFLDAGAEAYCFTFG